MTKIKLCGLSRPEDIIGANRLKPDYIGFVFWKRSRRYVTPKSAAALRQFLWPEIRAVGVFLDADPEQEAALYNEGVIDMIQLHGHEDEEHIRRVRELTGGAPGRLIKAFMIRSDEDIRRAEQSSADYILLDSGAGSGTLFDWELLTKTERPFFLAGGLTSGNVADAVEILRPYAVDVSSGIETDGRKDLAKMTAFVRAVRREGRT